MNPRDTLRLTMSPPPAFSSLAQAVHTPPPSLQLNSDSFRLFLHTPLSTAHLLPSFPPGAPALTITPTPALMRRLLPALAADLLLALLPAHYHLGTVEGLQRRRGRGQVRLQQSLQRARRLSARGATAARPSRRAARDSAGRDAAFRLQHRRRRVAGRAYRLPLLLRASIIGRLPCPVAHAAVQHAGGATPRLPCHTHSSCYTYYTQL